MASRSDVRRHVFGLLVTASLYSHITGEMEAAVLAMQRVGGFSVEPTKALEAAWPHVKGWWTATVGMAPAVACGIELVRSPSVEELRDREERRADRWRRRRERRARRAVRAPEPERRPAAFELGRHIDGDRLLPTSRGRVAMPLARLEKTALVIGAPGSGKTETLLRLAHGVTASSNWLVFVVDAKGDEHTQQRFAALMDRAGRRPRQFPSEAYDGWRGSGREIAGRLVQLIDWADEGGGAYYRDLSVNLVRAACTAPVGPPRTSAELLRRLDRNTLAELWAGHERAAHAMAVKGEHVDACRQRYAAFFDATEGQLDGRWAFEDSDCGYLLLNELLYGEEMSKLGRFIVEDFKQYLAARKETDERVLLIVDEFSAIADGEHVARMIEVVRSHGGAVVLAVQAYEGMGGRRPSRRPHSQLRPHRLPARDPRPRADRQSRRHTARDRIELPTRARALNRLRLRPPTTPAEGGPQRRAAAARGHVLRDRIRSRPTSADRGRPEPANRASGPRPSAPPDPAERPRPGRADPAMSQNGQWTPTLQPVEDRARNALAEPLLDAPAAARLLSVRPSWIYEAVRAGRIPHLKIGRHIRFLRGDLEEWVVTRRIG